MHKYGLFHIKKIKILIPSPDTKRKWNISKFPESFHVRTSYTMRLLQYAKSEEPVPSSKGKRNSCKSTHQNQSTVLKFE